MKVASRCWPLMLATACRFGGPSADPTATVDFPSDAAASDATSAEIESGGSVEPAVDAAADEASSKDASTDASADVAADSGGGGDAACSPPSSVPVCDPLTNTGCILLQCDVDTTLSMPTGVCVLAAPILGNAGATCTQTAGSTTCNPQLTCYSGTCRKVCFCDSDCGNGECCGDSDGTTGFRLCRACH